MLAGRQGSHVEDAAHCGPAAGDVALATILAAVVVDGGDPGKGRGFGVFDRAEFRHEGEHGENRHSADARHRAQTLGFGRELRVGGDVGIEQGIKLGQLLFQLTLSGVGEFSQSG